MTAELARRAVLPRAEVEALVERIDADLAHLEQELAEAEARADAAERELRARTAGPGPLPIDTAALLSGLAVEIAAAVRSGVSAAVQGLAPDEYDGWDDEDDAVALAPPPPYDRTLGVLQVVVWSVLIGILAVVALAWFA